MAIAELTTESRSPKLVVRFGDELLQAGHTAVPNLVLNHYAELGITLPEMMFIIHVWQFWWTERNPHPGLPTIAKRMDVTPRQVRNYTQSLKKKEFLEVHERHDENGGQDTNEFDFSKLLAAVTERAQLDTPRKNSAGGGRKSTPAPPLKSTSPKEDPVEINRLDEELSKVRQAPILEKNEERRRHVPRMQTSHQATVIPTKKRDRDTAAPLLRRATASTLARVDPEEEFALAHAKIVVEGFITDFAQQLRDQAPLGASITRAAKLYLASALPEDVFHLRMYEARRRTQAHSASIRNRDEREGAMTGSKAKMAYFFAVLENLLGVAREMGPRDTAPPFSQASATVQTHRASLALSPTGLSKATAPTQIRTAPAAGRDAAPSKDPTTEQQRLSGVLPSVYRPTSRRAGEAGVGTSRQGMQPLVGQERDTFQEKSRASPQKNEREMRAYTAVPNRAPDTPGKDSERDKGDAGDMPPISGEARRQLLIFMQDLARELNDGASLRSSTLRLATLYRRSGLALEDFIEHLSAARAITQERTAAIRMPAATATGTWQQNTLGYFFAVLEDQLGRRAREASD